MYEGGITTNLRPQEFYRAGTAYPGFEIPRSATINYYPHPSHISNYKSTGQTVIVSILYVTNAIIQKKETKLVRSKA